MEDDFQLLSQEFDRIKHGTEQEVSFKEAPISSFQRYTLLYVITGRELKDLN
jgi:hypothetical protein